MEAFMKKKIVTCVYGVATEIAFAGAFILVGFLISLLSGLAR